MYSELDVWENCLKSAVSGGTVTFSTGALGDHWLARKHE